MATKKGYWRRDWFVGLIITVAFLFIGNSTWIQSIERTAYDIGVRASAQQAGDNIAVIAIDDESIDNLGRWPWPRDILAAMINRLAEGGASVIGDTILLSEAQIDPGLKQFNDIITFYESSGLLVQNPEVAALADKLYAVRTSLDTDARLEESMGNVVMGMQFNISRRGVALGKPDNPLPDFVQRHQLDNVSRSTQSGSPLAVDAATPSLPRLGRETAGIGHLINLRDPDGGVRTELLAVDY